MATVRASCGDCGDQEITSRDVTILYNTDTRHSAYHFMCPCCNMSVVKEARPETIVLLEMAGVKRKEWNNPKELSEGESLRRSAMPALDHDDLLDFHELIADEGDDWLKFLGEVTQEDQDRKSPEGLQSTEGGQSALLFEGTQGYSGVDELDTKRALIDQFDEHLDALRMLAEGRNEGYLGTILDAARTYFCDYIELPPEHDPRNDGPGSDINNA